MTYFISIFFGTFVLEDVALVSSIALMSQGKMSWGNAFMACFLGISIGDLGLYLLGFAANKFEFIRRSRLFKKNQDILHTMQQSKLLSYSIVLSRFIPGTRFVTYVGAGFLSYPIIPFIILTVVSVFFWVLAAISAGQSLIYVFRDHWFVSLLILILFLQVVKSFVPCILDHWQRKALKFTWRRWLHFEFWPGWFFYIPVVPYYVYLSLRYRSFLLPFYASPRLKHGGLIGESKWDFLSYLNPKDPTTLKAFRISKNFDFQQTIQFLAANNMNYPFIMKPDIGQRGFAVRIIRNEFDLTEYLLLSPFDRIIQTFSQYAGEAGLFYVRRPSELKGFIFSVTDKKFPFVIGDGKNKLGDLILSDKRARIIAPLYFSRLKSDLDLIPENNKIIFLSECGNHCQGAIFFNGEKLITPELTEKIDQLAKQIPEFYFGRFDIRYHDQDSLRQGNKFEIVEVNGSGSEATHIWDAETKLSDAYATLFRQWSFLFAIGAEVYAVSAEKPKVKIRSFLKDCARVYFRQGELTVSS